MVERWRWSLSEIELMDWWDFISWSDGAKLMYEREEKARKAASRQR